MAKDVGISPPTAKQWLSILVSSGIVTLVEPYFNNALKRIIKSPNMYFLDTGLCAYLTRYKGLRQAVVNELLMRLSKKARFVTVAGKINSKTHPEAMYRKCGFVGNDIWHVLTKRRI